MTTFDRPPSRIDAELAWTLLTDAPLQGLSLSREAGTIFAWDEGDHLYVLDAQGQRRFASQAPGRILAGAASDDGSLLALLGQGSRLWLFDSELELMVDRTALADAQTLAVDPHGRHIVLASKQGRNQFFNRYGRAGREFETFQPLALLSFVPDRPILIGAAALGALYGLELFSAGKSGGLDAEEAWRVAMLSNVGRLTLTGNGGMILASCFNHGIQLYDLNGSAEGSYHLGGTVTHAVPDFAGRLIASATLEGELAVLNRAGNVRWKTVLSRPAMALEMDALGRYLIAGQATGEIQRIDLEPRKVRATAASQGKKSESEVESTSSIRPGSSRAGSVRNPAWTVPVALSDQQAESAVLAVLDDPPRIAVFTNSNRLQVFQPDGKSLGELPELSSSGVGRLLRTSPGWIAAASDRQIVLYDARHKTARRLDVSLAMMTHLAIRPDTFGLAIVQERDRVARATSADRWVWRVELDSPVEDLAIGSGGYSAVTTEDGRLRIFDAGGQIIHNAPIGPPEPLGLIEAPVGAPEGLAWITLARRLQVVRGHDLAGRVVWEVPVPWEAWQIFSVGRSAVVVAPDGRAMAFDTSGNPLSRSRSESPQGIFCPGSKGEPLRVVRQNVHLIVSDLSGRVHWRAVTDPPGGPIAGGRSGVAALIGRSLVWYPS